MSVPNTRQRLLLAIAAVLTISIAVTGLAAWVLLRSGMVVAPASLLAPLAEQLVAASVLSAQSAAVLYAPADQRGLLVQKQTPLAGAGRFPSRQ